MIIHQRVNRALVVDVQPELTVWPIKLANFQRKLEIIVAGDEADVRNEALSVYVSAVFHFTPRVAVFIIVVVVSC